MYLTKQRNIVKIEAKIAWSVHNELIYNIGYVEYPQQTNLGFNTWPPEIAALLTSHIHVAVYGRFLTNFLLLTRMKTKTEYVVCLTFIKCGYWGIVLVNEKRVVINSSQLMFTCISYIILRVGIMRTRFSINANYEPIVSWVGAWIRTHGRWILETALTNPNNGDQCAIHSAMTHMRQNGFATTKRYHALALTVIRLGHRHFPTWLLSKEFDKDVHWTLYLLFHILSRRNVYQCMSLFVKRLFEHFG